MHVRRIVAEIGLTARVSALLCALPFYWQRRDLTTLLDRLGAVRQATASRALTPSKAVRVVRRVSRLRLFALPFFPKPCLREAMALFHVLNRAGYPVQFNVGVRKQGEALVAHSWVALHGRAVVDGDDGRPFSTLYSYPEQQSLVHGLSDSSHQSRSTASGGRDAIHALHEDVVLVVSDECPGRQLYLSELLRDLSFVRTESPPTEAAVLRLSVRENAEGLGLPAGERVRLGVTGLLTIDVGSSAYLGDGESLLRVDLERSCAGAWLAPTFESRSAEHRQRFWAFGLLKLLRRQGLFGLHAAAVATPEGPNVLFVGPSGSGKTTLAIALIRRGGRFLTDDAILLRARSDGVDALALRRPFSVDVTTAGEYPDLVATWARAHHRVARKQRADAHAAYASQHVPGFHPQVIVFPTVTSQQRSSLRAISRSAALAHLLTQSGPELFDQSTMTAQLDVLARLLRQAMPYELASGRDLHRHPEAIVDLLQQVHGGPAWPGSSSN